MDVLLLQGGVDKLLLDGTTDAILLQSQEPTRAFIRSFPLDDKRDFPISQSLIRDLPNV